jgi:hypothetical protein
MLRLRAAPAAKFLELNLAGHKLTIFATPIVGTTALGAGEFEKLIL